MPLPKHEARERMDRIIDEMEKFVGSWCKVTRQDGMIVEGICIGFFYDKFTIYLMTDNHKIIINNPMEIRRKRRGERYFR